MDRYRALEHIANGIQAGIRIRGIISANRRTNENVPVKDSSRSNINDVLGVLAQYSPETHRSAMNSALNGSNRYSDVYSHLKHNFNSARSGSPGWEVLAKSLAAVRPLAGENRKTAIDKIVKILEILYS